MTGGLPWSMKKRLEIINMSVIGNISIVYLGAGDKKFYVST